MSTRPKRLSAFAANVYTPEVKEQKVKKLKKLKMSKTKIKKDKNSENTTKKDKQKPKLDDKCNATDSGQEKEAPEEITDIEHDKSVVLNDEVIAVDIGDEHKSDKNTIDLTDNGNEDVKSFKGNKESDKNGKSPIPLIETGGKSPERKRTKSRNSRKRDSSRNSNDDGDRNSKHRRFDNSFKKQTGGRDQRDSCKVMVERVVIDDSDSDNSAVVYISESSADSESKMEGGNTVITEEINEASGQRTARAGGPPMMFSTMSGMSDNEKLRPFALEVSSGALVLLPHPSEYIFKGKAIINLLVGKMVIQGYNLSPMTPVKVYSPESNSHVTIKTTRSENKVKNAVEKLDDLKMLNDSAKESMKTAMENVKSFVVVHVAKHKSIFCNIITRMDPFTKLFEIKEGETELSNILAPLGVDLLTSSSIPCLNVSGQLDSVLQLWSGEDGRVSPASILVCGGRDSGKSTTNRLLMNSAMSSRKVSSMPLYYLECDVGQSEFTPPGCVSLVKVTEPLLGPPFCNQRQPLYSSVFGGLSPKDDPDRYLACVRQCVEQYSLLDKRGRLVVNTMGWMTGLGFQLLVDIVRLVQPQCIVQLTSPQRYQNISPLTVETLTKSSWSDLATDGWHNTMVNSHYQPRIVHIEQPVTPGFQTRFRASDHRNLSLLSHLSADLEPGMTLTSKVPYCIHWEDIAVHVCESEVPWSQVMYSLNASLVALCKADTSKAVQYVDAGPLFFNTFPVCEWLGYGIVRGIDPGKKLLYVLTALPLDRLEMVNTLIKGSVTIPDSLLLSQKCKRLAYVDDSKKSLGASSVKPRRHMPRKNLGGPAQNN